MWTMIEIDSVSSVDSGKSRRVETSRKTNKAASVCYRPAEKPVETERIQSHRRERSRNLRHYLKTIAARTRAALPEVSLGERVFPQPRHFEPSFDVMVASIFRPKRCESYDPSGHLHIRGLDAIKLLNMSISSQDW
mmetsp:Transcript_1076/g.2919  ORF Transcript_1076/g.2919 Transcript_1076/m.2919 type:complete len:136 (-) Transcript_1076:50-457(-)